MSRRPPFGVTNRTDIPDSVRKVGVNSFGSRGYFREYFNQNIYEQAQDYVLGTSSQVTLYSADIYYDDTAGLFKDVDGNTVTLADYDRVAMLVDTATQDIDFPAGITIQFVPYDEIDLDSNTMNLAGEYSGMLLVNNGSVVITGTSHDLIIIGTATVTTTSMTGSVIVNGTKIINTVNLTIGAGKTLDVSAGTLTLADDQISGNKVEGGTIASITITSADINGGTIDGTPIGGSSVSTGAFSTVTATGDITAYFSDMRLKTKTRGIESSIDKIKALNGFYYVTNELAKSFGYVEENEQVALSAQEVQSVLPEAVSLAPFDTIIKENGDKVSKTGQNYITIKYEKLIPLLIEAIKEQQKQIESLAGLIDDNANPT